MYCVSDAFSGFGSDLVRDPLSVLLQVGFAVIQGHGVSPEIVAELRRCGFESHTRACADVRTICFDPLVLWSLSERSWNPLSKS